MKHVESSISRAINDDLIACGDTLSRLQYPLVRADIEEDGDFSAPTPEEAEEEFTLLEMSSREVQTAYARVCVLQGFNPLAGPGEPARFTRAEHILATEHLDPPMTPEELRYRNDQFLCEDDSTWLEREADKSEAWNLRYESSYDTSM